MSIRVATTAAVLLLAVVGCGGSRTDANPAGAETTGSIGAEMVSTDGALLYAADADGVRAVGSDEPLFEPPEDAVMLTLSPRGGRIAYLAPDAFGEEHGTIMLGTLGGGGPQPVLRVQDFGEFGWAQDGSLLYVSHAEPNEFGNTSPVLSIVDTTAGAVTSELHQPQYDPLTFGDTMTQHGSVAVSPDGTRVALTAGNYDVSEHEVIAVVQLTNPFSYTIIAPGTATDRWFPFAWVQDGLLVLHRSCPSAPENCRYAIELLDPGSGGVIRTLQGDLPSGTSPGEPALSPDGDTLGWGSYDGLFIGPADGKLDQITDGVNANTLSLGEAP